MEVSSIIFNTENHGSDEYVLIDGKRYNCLKNAKDEVRGRSTNTKEYAEGMEHLAWKVFVACSRVNEDLFEEATSS